VAGSHTFRGPGLAVLPGLASWRLLAAGVLCLVHPGVVMMTIRRARLADEPELRDIDAATWTAGVSPAPPPSAGAAFFGERTAPGDVLVAETDHAIAGYAALGQSGPLASHSHVLQIQGLAVHPARQRCGVGRRLVEACIELARDRGARKLSLRVLGGNIAARRLYESCGFTTEGTLREEFFLGGRYVDDVLMACLLDPAAGPEG
jgi:ribosomal protein S18 acetylase RimI-like enzyme